MATANHQLKYAIEIGEVCASGVACPPADAVGRDLTAYRWVKKPITHNCFNPQAVRNPRRLLSATDPEEKCSCWGLSMHTSLHASINSFQHLERSFQNARKVFGGWVAEGRLCPSHGKCTTPDHRAHFDLHEYKDASVSSVFSLCSSIPVAP